MRSSWVRARYWILVAVFFVLVLGGAQAQSAEVCDEAGGSGRAVLVAKDLDAALDLELAMIGFSLHSESPEGERATPTYQRRVRRTEVQGGRVETEGAPVGARLLVRASCAQGELQFLLEVVLDAGATSPGEPATRVIFARESPEDLLPRTLAIALSELLRTGLIQRERDQIDLQRAELRRLGEDLERSEASRKEAEAARQPSLAPVESPYVEPGEFQVSAALAASGTSSVGGPMYGGEVGVSYQWWRPWRISLEGTYAALTERTPLGRLGVQRGGLSLGGDFRFSRVQGLFLGPRFQLHFLRGQGHSYSEGVAEDPTRGYALSLSLRGSFELPIGEIVRLRTSLEAGPVIRGMTFTAAGREAYSLNGLQVQWGIGAVVRL